MDEKDFDKKMFDICYSQDEFNKELGRAKNGNVEAQYYVVSIMLQKNILMMLFIGS